MSQQRLLIVQGNIAGLEGEPLALLHHPTYWRSGGAYPQVWTEQLLESVRFLRAGVKSVQWVIDDTYVYYSKDRGLAQQCVRHLEYRLTQLCDKKETFNVKTPGSQKKWETGSVITITRKVSRA